MGFLKNLFKSYVDNNFVNDAQKILAVCRSYGPKERVRLKVCATTALAKIVHASEDTQDNTFRMLSEAMYSCRPLTSVEVGFASTFNLRLMEMQEHFSASKSPIDNSVAAGLPVWITSIRALSNVAVLPYARELWGILQNSDINDVCDQVDEIESRIRSQPIHTVLMRVRMLSTPTLFTQQ